MNKKYNRRKFRFVFSMCLLFILILFVLFKFWSGKNAKAAWFDSNWSYRQVIPVTAHTSLESNVYLTPNTFDSSSTSKFQSDCGDLRFTDNNGSLLKYYIVSGCGTGTTTVHVLIPSFAAGASDFYMYYGNQAAVNGFEASDFATGASGVTLGSNGSEEIGPGPLLYLSLNDAQGTTAQDATTNNNDGSISGAIWKTEDMCVSGKCLFFDGTDDVVTVASTVSNIRTVSFWAKVNSTTTTEQLIDLNGTDYIQSVSGTITANSFGTETIYINGKSGSTITANTWNHIEVTTSSGLTGSGIKLAQVSTNYGQVFIDEVKMYGYARTAAQVQIDFNQGAEQLGKQNQKNFLSDGLVGYWKMDETSWTNDCSTGTAIDSSGNGNNATSCPTSTGPTGGVGAKFGNGGFFDQVDDYLSVGDPASGELDVTATESFSIALWYQHTSSSSFNQRLVTKKTGTATAGYFIASNNNLNTVSMGVGDGGSHNTSTPDITGITNDNWYYIVFVIDRSKNTIYGYKNGELLTSVDISTFGSFANSTNLIIGANDGGSSTFFKGYMDEVRMYKRALSSAEVQTLYNWAPGPVGYWNFDENTGVTANDSSGFDNSATLTNSPTWTTGRYGAGINFGGSNQQVTRADDSDFDFIDDADMSFEVFFRHGAASAQEVLLSKYQEAGYKIIMESDGDITCGLDYDSTWSPTDSATSTAATYDDGNWHHVACVKTGASSLKLYIDGVLIASDNSISATNTLTNSDPLYIGIDADGTSNDFVGQLDEVKIYNYARTSSQIIEDMNGGHPLGGSPLDSPIVHYTFDEDQGQTVNNTGNGGNSYNGTLGNTSSSSTDDPTWKTKVNCKMNGCLSFDGGDFVKLTQILGDSTNYTISAWINSADISSTRSVFGEFTGTDSDTRNWLTVTTGIPVIDQFPPSGGASGASEALSASQWYHLAYVRDGSKQYYYINGRKYSTTPETYTGDAATLALIGARDNNGSKSSFFSGLMDEFKIYNTALTEQQIKVDMNAGSTINYSVLGSLESSLFSDGSGNPPVGYWPMDENRDNSCSGGTNDVCDLSGNGNDGANTNMESSDWVPGKIGSGLDFDGTDELVSISDNALLDPSDEMTVMTWFQIDQTASTKGEDMRLIRKSDSGASGLGYVIEIQSSTNKIQARWTNTGSTTYNALSTSTITSLKTWYHVAMVKTGTTIKIYLNGKDDTATSDTTTGTHLNASGALTLGASATSSRRLDGRMDDVKLYDYARTAAQISYDYNRGLPVGYWQFDECQGSTAFDNSGKGNNGTITIGASGEDTVGTCNTSSTAWGTGATGKYNSSLSLDGTDDYIQVTDTSDLRFDASSADFSLFAWVKRAANGEANIISKEDADNDGYRLQFNSSNNLVCSEDSTDVTSSSTITDTNWHLVGCSIDRDGNGQVYIDGISNGSAVSMGTDAMATTANIRIGTRSYTSTNYLNGQIDQVLIYNYSLSASQVKNLYNQNAGVRFGPTTGMP